MRGEGDEVGAACQPLGHGGRQGRSPCPLVEPVDQERVEDQIDQVGGDSHLQDGLYCSVQRERKRKEEGGEKGREFCWQFLLVSPPILPDDEVLLLVCGFVLALPRAPPSMAGYVPSCPAGRGRRPVLPINSNSM